LFENVSSFFLVYCACLLGSHSTPLSLESGTNPLFFTNIFDIPQLGTEHKYIACTYSLFIHADVLSKIPPLHKMHKTHFSHNIFILLTGTTEKIFETKGHLYDAYVDNQNIKCKPYLSSIQHVNSYDKTRYDRLLDYR
jgi:hypothetical protein